MLVVGDAALKEIKPDHNVSRIEVIGKSDHEYYVEHILNAGYTCEIVNRYCKKFELKNKRKLFYYSTEELGSLDNLVEEHFAKNCEFKFAPPRVLFMLESIKVREIFYDVYNWDKAVKTYNYLFKNHILPLKLHDKDILKEISLQAVSYYTFVTSSPLINNNLYEFKKFKFYKEEDLSNIYASFSRNNYMKLLYKNNVNDLNDITWSTYTLEEKIAAVLERVYTLATNEFIIPFWQEHKKIPRNIKEILKRTLMIIVSTTQCEWFADFIVHHYLIINNKFNRYFVNIFTNAIKFGDLEKI